MQCNERYDNYRHCTGYIFWIKVKTCIVGIIGVFKAIVMKFLLHILDQCDTWFTKFWVNATKDIRDTDRYIFWFNFEICIVHIFEILQAIVGNFCESGASSFACDFVQRWKVQGTEKCKTLKNAEMCSIKSAFFSVLHFSAPCTFQRCTKSHANEWAHYQ